MYHASGLVIGPKYTRRPGLSSSMDLSYGATFISLKLFSLHALILCWDPQNSVASLKQPMVAQLRECKASKRARCMYNHPEPKLLPYSAGLPSLLRHL
jgi:hypothetical protein